MSRLRENDVKLSSQEFDLGVQNNESLSFNVYRQSVIIQNGYTVMTEDF